jgi:hypothetical protein
VTNYEQVKAAALATADQRRRDAEEEYQRSTADLRLPSDPSFPSTTANRFWEAEHSYKGALANALKQYEDTVAAALAAA